MLPILSASSSEGFSVSLLIAAAGVAIGWLVLAAMLGLARRPPRIRASGATMDLPPEPPAVAGLLVNDFVVPAETAPAIVLDLAARRTIDLDEVQPGKTICRVRGTADTPLTHYEQRVLDSLREKAIDGIVPTDALTTGPEEQSKAWHRALAKEVVADAQSRGLTHDRWPTMFSVILFLGLAAIGVLLYLASDAGGDNSGDRGVVAAIAGGIAVAVVTFGTWILGRLSRSLAQLPTESGRAAAAGAAGLEHHLRDDRLLADLPPAAVKVRGRHFAYAAAFGAAPLAVDLLPMGAEDNHRAWSRVGGHWRRVRVRYPRSWPPAWGKDPAFAAFLGVLSGAVAGLAIWGLALVADSAQPAGISHDAWDRVGHGALLAMIPFAILALWALFVLVRAVPDLWSTRSITGDIVRDRRFKQWFSSGDDPKYWYYLAIDDGSDDHVTAFRVRADLWQACSQGETVTAMFSPRLGYVRSITRSEARGDRPVEA